MKIIIATDSFKGTLKSQEACAIIAAAIGERVPGAEIVLKPMADGGEGTAAAMMEADHGRWIARQVTGPLADMEVEVGFVWFDHSQTAVVEMASASGLELLSAEQMDPMRTTTYGTGQLIAAAASYGARQILLAVGGSATVDGGVGAAAALGWRFRDIHANPAGFGGGALGDIVSIERPEGLMLPPVRVLCDVDNPLCGPQGAARVFAPQKGADPAMVEQLEANLAHLARLVMTFLGRNIADIPGAGAAGGLAGGAVAFMDAEIVSGIETIIETSRLQEQMASADWIITGEGDFDSQSLGGKVISGIAELARSCDVRIGVIAGQVSLSEDDYRRRGIAAAMQCRPPDMPLEEALKDCRRLLSETALRFADEVLLK